MQVLPIIQPGTPDTFFVDLEGSGLDDPQPRPGRHTRSPDIAGILGDFRLVQHDMRQWRSVWLRRGCRREKTVCVGKFTASRLDAVYIIRSRCFSPSFVVSQFIFSHADSRHLS